MGRSLSYLRRAYLGPALKFGVECSVACRFHWTLFTLHAVSQKRLSHGLLSYLPLRPDSLVFHHSTHPAHSALQSCPDISGSLVYGLVLRSWFNSHGLSHTLISLLLVHTYIASHLPIPLVSLGVRRCVHLMLPSALMQAHISPLRFSLHSYSLYGNSHLLLMKAVLASS